MDIHQVFLLQAQKKACARVKTPDGHGTRSMDTLRIRIKYVKSSYLNASMVFLPFWVASLFEVDHALRAGKPQVSEMDQKWIILGNSDSTVCQTGKQ